MNHNEAVRLQAVEKYLLRELPPDQLEAYEEHYFDCPACAEELKATVAFMETTRQVFREEAPQVTDVKTLIRSRGGWFGWLRPAFAVPVFAALILLIGYQNGVTIPHLKDATSNPSAQIFSTTVHLAGSVRGGSESGEAATKISVHAGEGFILDFDFTPARSFGAYTFQLQDDSGRPVLRGVLAGNKTNQAVQLPVSGLDRPGKYNLVFFADDNSNSPAASVSEVQRLTFTVEFLP
jgi:hypothetical protein